MSSIATEHCSPSVSKHETGGLDSFQAGTSDSTAKFLGRVRRPVRKRPAKLTIKESSEPVIDPRNATALSSEQSRMIKTRYVTMQPNLKSVENYKKPTDQDGYKSSSVVISEVQGEGEIEYENREQRKKDTDVLSTSGSSRLETVSADGVSREPLTQSTEETTMGTVTIGKTRSRYRRMKPNLLKQTEAKSNEVKMLVNSVDLDLLIFFPSSSDGNI